LLLVVFHSIASVHCNRIQCHIDKNLLCILPQKYGKNIGIKGWGIRILKGKELQYDVADLKGAGRVLK